MKSLPAIAARVGLVGAVLALVEALCPPAAFEGWSFWLLASTIEELRDTVAGALALLRIRLPEAIVGAMIYTAFYALIAGGDLVVARRPKYQALTPMWRDEGSAAIIELVLPALAIVAMVGVMFALYHDYATVLDSLAIGVAMIGEAALMRQRYGLGNQHKRLWQVILAAAALIALNELM